MKTVLRWPNHPNKRQPAWTALTRTKEKESWSFELQELIKDQESILDKLDDWSWDLGRATYRFTESKRKQNQRVTWSQCLWINDSKRKFQSIQISRFNAHTGHEEHKKLKKFGETQTQETLLIAHMRRKWGVAILIASAENFELLKEIKDKEGRTDENVLKP